MSNSSKTSSTSIDPSQKIAGDLKKDSGTRFDHGANKANKADGLGGQRSKK